MGDAARTRAELGKEDGIGEEGAPPARLTVVEWLQSSPRTPAEHGARTV